jgi:hypothetical protein
MSQVYVPLLDKLSIMVGLLHRIINLVGFIFNVHLYLTMCGLMCACILRLQSSSTLCFERGKKSLFP